MVPIFMLVSLGLKVGGGVVKHQMKKSKNKKMVNSLESGSTSQQSVQESYYQEDMYQPPAYVEKSTQQEYPYQSGAPQGLEQSQLIGVPVGSYNSIAIDFSRVTKIIVNQGKAIHYISFLDATETVMYKIGTPNYSKGFSVISLPDPSEQISQIKFAFHRRNIVAMTFITNHNRVETVGIISRQAMFVDYVVPPYSRIIGIESYSDRTINGLKFISARA